MTNLSSIKFGNKSIFVSTTQWMDVINSVAIDANVKCAIVSSTNSIICSSINAKALAMALEKKTKRLVFIKSYATS